MTTNNGRSSGGGGVGDRPVLTLAEAAELLSVSLSTMKRLTGAGVIPTITVGESSRGRRVLRVDVDRYVAQQRAAR